MDWIWFKLLLLLTLTRVNIAASNVTRPNIVIIMSDDMGFDDASYRGSNDYITPNIDALAYSGIILNDLYTPAMCTPSRAALLTGKYPLNTGMQHYVIINDEPWSLPINETTMAQVFQANGYYTALIGKWHLGFSRKAYTPTMRGFDKHFGYLGAFIDYYDQTLIELRYNYSRGHDFRTDKQISHEHIGTYMTDLLTREAIGVIESQNVTEKPLFLLLSHLAPHAGNTDDPLQAPEEEINKFSYIQDKRKRTYAAMMSKLDESIGLLIEALSKKGILNNTIIMYLSDNGGPTQGMHATTASNYPLRGQKNSPWEGGIRSSASIWSTEFEKLGSVWQQRMYSADIFPTLAAAAGINLNADYKLDGLNLWSALKYGYESVEREIMHNIDDTFQYVAYMKGKWKYVNGTTIGGLYDGWLSARAFNESELDVRAQKYEELIRNTTVWQSLSTYNAASSNTNITKLRANSQITCRYNNTLEGVACNALQAPCIFDLDIDPCEQNNLYDQMKDTKIVLEMLERIAYFRANAHKPNNKPTDPHSDPCNYNNEWTWWEDEQRGDAATSLNSQYFLITILNVVTITIFNIFNRS